mmetsp:Transcript_1989/g.2707  ORF Transcript_1989/g.2707 Transcript_1989/m.2707 type:complete len:389 (-) Transcript_1989:26-1192(-)
MYDGAKISLLPCNSSKNAMIWFEMTTYTIGTRIRLQFQSMLTGKCMEARPNGRIEQWTCNSTKTEQLFDSIAHIDEKVPTLVNHAMCEKKVVTVVNETYAPGDTDISLWEEGRLMKVSKESNTYLLGPYYPGDQPRRVVKLSKDTLAVTIEFIFSEVDISKNSKKHATDYSSSSGLGVFDADDDPLSLLINNVELDFGKFVNNKELNLIHYQGDINYTLAASGDEPGTNTITKRNVKGYTIGGIFWSIVKIDEKNVLGGEGLERESHFIIEGTPRIIFDHTHRLDLRFLIKDGGKAQYYAFGGLNIRAITYNATECYQSNNITSINGEWTPWENFRGEMEPVLQDEIRKDLITAYYDKPGHCLENVKPIVNVNLIQKQKWSEAKPRCD